MSRLLLLLLVVILAEIVRGHVTGTCRLLASDDAGDWPAVLTSVTMLVYVRHLTQTDRQTDRRKAASHGDVTHSDVIVTSHARLQVPTAASSAPRSL